MLVACFVKNLFLMAIKMLKKSKILGQVPDIASYEKKNVKKNVNVNVVYSSHALSEIACLQARR